MPKTQGTLQKRGCKYCKSQRLRKTVLKFYLSVVSAGTHIKSHQGDSPNISLTRMIPMGMLKWTEKTHQASKPCSEL